MCNTKGRPAITPKTPADTTRKKLGTYKTVSCYEM
jgi:hypothetical protein